MNYSAEEIMQYVKEEDVKFIRLAFCDVYGRQKNVSIMPSELGRAFSCGVAIDASAIKGFGGEVRSDLFLHPDPSTLAVLPWRPEHGRVVRMFCEVKYPDGRTFEADTRSLLRQAVSEARAAGVEFMFGSEFEFYLLKTDEFGQPTKEPFDNATYMDIAPLDKGENVRREICLTLERMGIYPEASHHEEGPGQNEIDFRYADPLSAADNAVTFLSVVRTIAARNGLWADFSPKPLENNPGNGFHINISAKKTDGENQLKFLIGGLLDKICDMTAFLNPTENSYKRLGEDKAPSYVSWSHENRSQLIRIPATKEEPRAELRSPDPCANPYIAFALMIRAALDGLSKKMLPQPATDSNLFTEKDSELSKLKKLPSSLDEAKKMAKSSKFIEKYLPEIIIKEYCD